MLLQKLHDRASVKIVLIDFICPIKDLQCDLLFHIIKFLSLTFFAHIDLEKYSLSFDKAHPAYLPYP